MSKLLKPKSKCKGEHSHFGLDRLGIGLSGLCLFHCLALPFFVVFTPLLGVLTPWHLFFHLILFVFAVYVARASLWQGFRHHRNKGILALGGLGCSLVLISLFTESHHFVGEMGLHKPSNSVDHLSLIISTLGGLSLVLAHSLNIRECRKLSLSHVHDKNEEAIPSFFESEVPPAPKYLVNDQIDPGPL